MTPTRAETAPSGVVLVDKPEGPTSHGVVARARSALGERRIGHTGTLDPFASGLLVLCVGPATRLVEYFHDLDKTYRARLRLGVETATHDTEGDVVGDSDAWRSVDRGRIAAALGSLTGAIRQRPPAFSAKRVDGERAHRVARAGREVELEPVEVRVHALELVELHLPSVVLEARVGTGTYVRALARDLGRELGCGAHLTSLRRTRIGPFRVERAAAPDAVGEARERWESGMRDGAWLEPAEALPWLPVRELDEDEARLVVHGSQVELGRLEPPGWPESPDDGQAVNGGEGPVVLLHGGRLAAVAERRGERLQPRKVFADVS